jgi:hypothetical protein
VLKASAEAATIIETREKANFLFIVKFLEKLTIQSIAGAACGGPLTGDRLRMRHGFAASPGSAPATAGGHARFAVLVCATSPAQILSTPVRQLDSFTFASTARLAPRARVIAHETLSASYRIT